MNVPNVNFTPISNDYATVSVNRVNFTMNDGYVYYRRSDYADLVDEEGNPRDPYPEEISYLRYWGNVPVGYDFSDIVIVAEADVPANQIN